MALRLVTVLLSCAACSGALLGGGASPMRSACRPARTAAVSHMSPVSGMAPLASPARTSLITMQQNTIDESSQAFYDGYVETDPTTGESKALSLDDKEKLYLECLDAYYNEDGKQLLADDEYEKLKLDLDFDGSRVAVFSKDEIKFVLANKRYKMGKPVMDDTEYDELRGRLKKAGSLVVLHEGASCTIDGICKSDLTTDDAKTRLLYLPGTAGGLILTCELIYWTLHLDPILSIVLGALPAYAFGVWFTENVFCQKPLVVQGSCPNCQVLQNVYFGDLFSVITDGLAGPAAPPADELEFKCANCKTVLTADRNRMVLTGKKDL